MQPKAVFKYCKTLGCCDLCCLRYIGVKSPSAYENYEEYIVKYQDKIKSDPKSVDAKETLKNETVEVVSKDKDVNIEDINKVDTKDNDNTPRDKLEEKENDLSPPLKKRKLDVCCSCTGVLQKDNWQESFDMVKEVLDMKGYESKTFACALSAPIAILLREKAIALRLSEQFRGYDHKSLTALKEAWKWSFGIQLATHINKTLDSGAVSPLLVTVSMEYKRDLQELEILKNVSPQLFKERSKQKRRFAIEFTRRSVEQALERASLASLLSAGGGLPESSVRAHCVSVVCTHSPTYLAGRYIKLSRNLPQSPWILDGKRVLPSSVQEIIYAPLAELYKFSSDKANRRLKIIAAGREDVDVRCLGDGRPFAIEITDPVRELTAAELAQACEDINKSGDVIVKKLVVITRDDLVQLKKGEETKSKTYEALCIKLSHSKHDDVAPTSPIAVTEKDLEVMNELTSSGEHETVQRTPVRVLHRRPLLARARRVLQLSAAAVPGHPQLFRISVQTSAGTYVKEWVHSEFGRSAPSLGSVLAARLDLLALDVTAVHLDWPPET